MLALAAKRLVEETGLSSRVGQEVGPVVAAIDISATGTYTLQSLLRTSSGKAKIKIPAQMWMPPRKGRTSGVSPEFIVDKVEYVLGDLEAPKGKKNSPGQVYLDSINSLAESTRDKGAIAFSKFLNNRLAVKALREQCESLMMDGVSGNLLIRFEGESLHDRPLVKQFGDSNSGDLLATAAPCALCGEVKLPRRLHPKISGGGLRGSLISFNSKVTDSYHFNATSNFPVCNDCCNAYSLGLQRLLKVGFPDPVTCDPMPRASLPLAKNKVAIYWPEPMEDAGSNHNLDLYKIFTDGDVEALPHEADDSLFNYAVLSQLSTGRLTVEDFTPKPLNRLVEGLRLYFDQLKLESLSKFDFDQNYKYTPFWYKAMLSAGGKTPPPSFVAALFACALNPNMPFPRWVLLWALHRVSRTKRVKPGIASIIKAILKRNYEDTDMKATLNPEHPSSAYQFGCYFALVEYVHRQAIKSNRTISDMFLNRAMTRPLSIHAQLEQKFNLCVKKEPKLGWHNTRRRELWERIGDTLPLSFSLQQQGEFTAGYYLQNAEMYKPKANKPESVA